MDLQYLPQQQQEVWEYLFPLPYGSSFHFAPSLFSILRIQYTTPNPIVKEDMYAARRRHPLFSR